MPIPAAPLHAPAPSARSPIRRALTALTLTTAACGSSKASTSRDSNAVEKPDLTAAAVPAISAVGLYIAQQRSYFTAAGLRVKIVPVASGVDAIPNLASGSVDIDEGQWAADLSAEAAGAVRLYGLAAASAGGPGVQEVVVPAGSPVTTVVQLRGKTIAVNALGGLAVLLTDNVLADHGVPVKDVHYVPVPFPAMGAALAVHRVDAAFIAEPSLSAAEIAVGAVPLFDVSQGAAQNFPISGYVVTQAWIARYPRTAAFVSALERGQQVAATDRAAVEHALIPALHISKTTAAVMALGTFPLSVSAVAVQPVADLTQSNGLLARSVASQGADHPMSKHVPQTGPEVTQRVAEGFAAAAAAYDSTGTEFFQQMGEHPVAQAGIAPGAIVLDIGCGKGAVTIPAARAAGSWGQVTGIDLAGPMMEHARTAAARAGLPMVTFGPGDAADPPFPAGSFDVVLAGNLVQFLPQPMTAITGWGSLLTGGGTLAFSWNLAEHPYWVPVLAAFDSAMPEGMTGFTAMLRRPPFESVEDVQGLLAASRYQAITTRVHTLTLTYRASEQWWAAAQSQGPWAACWRHITPDRLETAQREAFALLDELREPDGSTARTMLFACTTGRKEAR